LLNLRQIDRKFVISGGFTDLHKDVKYLVAIGVVAILDVGLTADDDIDGMVQTIGDACFEEGIEYAHIPMRDDEFNWNLEGIWTTAAEILRKWEEKYPKRRQLILVKCATGVSRSASCLIYYLCEKNRWSYVEALNYVRDGEAHKTEFGVSLNNYFHNTLKGMFPDNKYTSE
jgi:hypothetical protein